MKDSPSPPRPGYRGRLWLRLLVAYLLPTAVILAGIGWLAYRAARVSLEEQLGDSLAAVARQAASLVAKPWVVELTPGDEQSRTYRNLKQKLAELASSARVRQIYLFDLQERALLDSEGAFPIGEAIPQLAADRAELRQVFAGSDQSSVLFSGRDGQLYKTGFSPVRIDGQVRAAVGVDGSARFFDPLSELGHTLWMVSVVALALVVLVTLFVSRRITRPLGRLTEAARTIGRGELSREIPTETTDEIGFLSHTLNEMRQSIEQRDQQLQLMLSGIAHEVRNPLGGMALFAGLLKEELAGNATALQHLQRINSELDYLARVVSDFLDFARKRPLEIGEVDPGLEFEEIRNLCAGELARRGVAWSCTIAPGIKAVWWDRERMRRVMLNLVQNGIQASGSGGSVEITLSRNQEQLLLRIADRGEGIAEDKRTQIFQPFFTTRQQGTGLGLALAKKIVEAHGGTISFSSQVGLGTTFEILLPVTPPLAAGKEAAPWPAS